MHSPLEKQRTQKYYIHFNTTEMRPYLLATTVELGHELVRDMDMPMRIDLRDHPLYERLEDYVHANPSAARRRAQVK